MSGKKLCVTSSDSHTFTGGAWLDLDPTEEERVRAFFDTAATNATEAQRDIARQVRTATGAYLDYLASQSFLRVERDKGETDEAFRERVQAAYRSRP